MNLTNWLQAQCALLIWNPMLWDWYPIEPNRTRRMLAYKARGIVLHDRALNGFDLFLPTEQMK